MRRVALLFSLLLAFSSHAYAASDPPRRFVVFFQEWSAALDDAAQSVITDAAAYAKSHPKFVARVGGFADPTGSKAANILLSDLRAQRVVDQLREAGIPAARLTQRGHGAVKYALSSQESRRVEVDFAAR